MKSARKENKANEGFLKRVGAATCLARTLGLTWSLKWQ